MTTGGKEFQVAGTAQLKDHRSLCLFVNPQLWVFWPVEVLSWSGSDSSHITTRGKTVTPSTRKQCWASYFKKELATVTSYSNM